MDFPPKTKLKLFKEFQKHRKAPSTLRMDSILIEFVPKYIAKIEAFLTFEMEKAKMFDSEKSFHNAQQAATCLPQTSHTIPGHRRSSSCEEKISNFLINDQIIPISHVFPLLAVFSPFHVESSREKQCQIRQIPSLFPPTRL